MMSCKIFEDNQAAFLLAAGQQLSEGATHFAIKFHWFWQCVHNEESNPDGWLLAEKIAADLQDADCLTEGLVKVKFEANRNRVQGW